MVTVAGLAMAAMSVFGLRHKDHSQIQLKLLPSSKEPDKCLHLGIEKEYEKVEDCAQHCLDRQYLEALPHQVKEAPSGFVHPCPLKSIVSKLQGTEYRCFL